MKLELLRSLYTPLFIRRTKKEIFKCVSSELAGRELTNYELPMKTDLAIWIPLSKTQKEIYSLIVNNDEVRKILNVDNKKRIFIIIIILKSLCVHPLLLLHGTYSNELKKEMIKDEDDRSSEEKSNDRRIESKRIDTDSLENQLDTSAMMEESFQQGKSLNF